MASWFVWILQAAASPFLSGAESPGACAWSGGLGARGCRKKRSEKISVAAAAAGSLAVLAASARLQDHLNFNCLDHLSFACTWRPHARSCKIRSAALLGNSRGKSGCRAGVDAAMDMSHHGR